MQYKYWTDWYFWYLNELMTVISRTATKKAVPVITASSFHFNIQRKLVPDQISHKLKT